jgi:hypothetical protein
MFCFTSSLARRLSLCWAAVLSNLGATGPTAARSEGTCASRALPALPWRGRWCDILRRGGHGAALLVSAHWAGLVCPLLAQSLLGRNYPRIIAIIFDRRLFSKQALVNFAKGLVKLALIGTIITLLL